MTTPPEPRYAPEVSVFRRLLGPLYITGVGWFRVHYWAVTHLPEWGLRIVIVLFTTFFFFALRNIRRAMAANLEVVLGPCGWWRRQLRIYRTMWSFAWAQSERYENLGTDRRVEVTVDGEEHWRQLLASRRGFVLVTAHIGHWEVGSMLASDLGGRRVIVVREAETDPRAQAFVRELLDERRSAAYEIRFAGADEPALGPALLVALREGAIVALQGDRPRARGRSVSVGLFGGTAEMPVGPALLARAAGVPLLPVFVLREGRLRARVVFRRPITVTAAGSREEALAAATSRFAADLETAIGQAPHQWFAFREVFEPGQE